MGQNCGAPSAEDYEMHEDTSGKLAKPATAKPSDDQPSVMRAPSATEIEKLPHVKPALETNPNLESGACGSASSGQLPLPKSKYGVAISWDHVGATLDLDIQCVVVDVKGTIIDAVYYNNLKALKALTHSGDEVTGERTGFDEVIWASLGKLPPHVRMLLFVVAANNGGQLSCAVNGNVHVLEERKENEVMSISMPSGRGSVAPVAMMLRGADAVSWTLNMLDSPATSGKHFIDILEPTIGNLIRGIIPTAPKKQKVAFAMEKSAVFDLPESSSKETITAGLGWDVASSVTDEVDLDVSAVLFSKEGKEIGAVFFGNTEEFGIVHSGDNHTGEGEGDDEQITVNLLELPDTVDQIFFCANIYSKGITFDQVSNAYCRIVDNRTGAELAKYVLKEGRGERGLLLSRLFREQDGIRWGFQALGTFCRGQTWKDSVRDMFPIVKVAPRSMQHRTSSRDSNF